MCNCPLGRTRASLSPPSVSFCHCPSRNRRRAIRSCENRNIHVRHVPEVAPPCSAYSTLASPERFAANILNSTSKACPGFSRSLTGFNSGLVSRVSLEHFGIKLSDGSGCGGQRIGRRDGRGFELLNVFRDDRMHRIAALLVLEILLCFVYLSKVLKCLE